MAKLTKAQIAELERRQLIEEINAYSSQVSGEIQSARRDAAKFEGVSSSFDSTESPFVNNTQETDSGFVDRIQGGLQSLVGSPLAAAAGALSADSDTALPNFAVGPRLLISPFLSDETKAANRQYAERINEETAPVTDPLISGANYMLDRADANNALADASQKRRAAEREGGFAAGARGMVDEAFGSVLGNPSMAASIIGGPFAAVGGADAYAQTYARARRAGATHDQANTEAMAAGSIETAMSIIPAGKLVDKTPLGAAIKRKISNEFGTVASRTLTGTVKTGVGEAVEEMATEVAQTEANRALSALASDPEQRKRLQESLPQTIADYARQVMVAGIAGGGVGSALGAPMSRHEAIADAARKAQDTINAISRNELNIPNRPQFGPLEPTPLERRSIEEQSIIEGNKAVGDWLGSPLTTEGNRPARTIRPTKSAVAAEAQRLADQADVSQSDTISDLEDFNRSPVGAVSRANTIPTSPESPATADVVAFNERQMAAALARDAANKEAAAIVKREETAKKKATSSALSARKRAFLLEASKQSANLPPAERATALSDAITAWNAQEATATAAAPNAGVTMPTANLPFEMTDEQLGAAPASASQTVSEAPQGAPAPTAPATTARAKERAAEAEKKRQAAIDSLMADDPTLTRQEAEETFTPAEPLETEADIRAAYSGGRLSSIPATPAPAKGMDASSFITALAGRVGKGDSKQANVVAKLVRDGKLVVTNNAEELEPGANPNIRGQYDPATGKLYINAAAMDAANPVGSLLQEVASHEVDHAARVSGNTDVRNAVSGILGDTKAARFIEQLKTSSDPIAVEARANATNSGETGERHDLELAAYAMQAASREYANSKGIPALWRGVVSAARTTAQKYIPGMEVNLKDLGYLGQKMLEATATTEQSLAGTGEQLNTILSKESTGFNQAQREGITYLSKDGAEKFVISDAESTIRPGAVKKLLTGETMKLSEVLDHPELYENIPFMKNLPITSYDAGNGAFATYFPDPSIEGEGEIILSPALTEGKTGIDLREAILHEAQHHVQNQDKIRRQHFFDQASDRSPEEAKLVADARAAAAKSEKSTRRFLDRIGGAMKQVSPAVKRAMSSVIFDRNMSDFRKARELAGYIQDEGLTEYLDEADQVIQDMDDYNKLVPQVNAARESYFENITEQEAFFTQDNANNPNPAINPEQAAFGRPIIRGKGGERLNSLAPTPVPTSPVPYTPSLSKKVIDSLAGQLLWHGKAGKPLGLLQEWQKGFASNIAARASTFFHQLKAGQETVAHQFVKEGKAASIKEARKAVSEMITSRFTAIGNIPDKRRRDTMIARFVQQYPSLAPLQEAINDINALTDDIIASRMRDKKPLSEDELVQIRYMIDNKSKYVTGVYAAFQGREGRKFVDKLYEDIATANDLIAKGKEVPAAIKEQVRVYRAALKFVVNNDIAVSDPEHLNALSLDNVRDLYNMWRPTLAPDAEGLQNQMTTSEEGYDEQRYKDAMSAAIQKGVTAADTAQFEQLGSQLLESLLRQTATGPIARYMRGAKLDTSILEHKEKIPQELKDLYGEVTDLPALLAITMAKQGELAAQSRLLADIKANHTGDLVIEGNAAEMNKPGNKEFTERLEGEKWGPLEGMMIKPSALEALTDYRDTFLDLSTATSLTSQNPDMLANYLTSRTGKVMSRTGKAAKIATVVTSPINMVMNAMGSAASMTMAGGVKPQYLWRGLKLAAELVLEGVIPQGIGGKFVPQNTADRDLYFRMNVGESAQAQNMRRAPTDLLRKLVQNMETEGKREITLGSWNKLRNSMGTGWATLMELFALSDAWIKFPIMLQRANQLEKFAKANGDKYNIEDIYKQASDYAQDIGMSYNRTAPIVRAAEQTSFLGTFMPYLQSTFRSIGYGAKHTLGDIKRAMDAKTPAARLKAAEIAARSAAGVLAVLASPQIYQAVANALNDDDEEKAIEAEKGLMEDRFKYGNLVAMGQNADGKNLYFQGSRIDARGPATDLLRILTSDASPEDKWEATKEGLKGLWILPGMFESMMKLGTDILTDEKVKNRTTKTERQLPWLTEKIKSAGTAVGVDYSTMESAIEVMDRFNPAGFNYFDPKAEKATQGDKAELGAAALVALAGYRLAAADPEAAALYAGLDYKDIKKAGREQIAANLGNVSPEAAIAEFREQAAKERRAISKAGDVYEAMKKVGMSEQEAAQIFKDLKIFDATDMANIRNKTYEANDEEWTKEYSTLLSSQSLKQRLKDNPEAEKNVDELKELISKLGYKKLKDNR